MLSWKVKDINILWNHKRMKIRILAQIIFHPVVYLLALKTMQQKRIDFLNKNQCQKSAVINVSIIYFHILPKVTLQLKVETLPFLYLSQGF